MNASLELQKTHNFNLAFMECFASSVLTYVRLMGHDHRRFLLDYWNLDYQFRTLLSSKGARRFSLDYLYGIDMKFEMGSLVSMADHIDQGKSVILFCTASKLDYFPRNFLGMESGGFKHSILIHGAATEAGLPVFDAIADYAGYTSPAVLALAGATGRGETLHYFVFTNKPVNHLPDIQEVLSFSSRRNLEFYEGQHEPEEGAFDQGELGEIQRKQAWVKWFSNRRGGRESFRLFAADLQDSLEWPQPKRDDWVKRNSMTVSSIRHLRGQIWNTYRELLELGEADVEDGNNRIEAIVHLWNRVNYLLLKYKNAADIREAAGLLHGKMEEVKNAELRFLTWLMQKVNCNDGAVEQDR